MQDIDRLADEIVRREGGYVNDPDDPGGATKYGVTLATMQRLGLDLNSSGAVDAADVRLLSRQKALEIFKAEYFHKPGIDRLPEVLWPAVFDMQVNAGRAAVRILQELLNEMGAALVVDGVIGPLTEAAAAGAHARAPEFLADAYGIARRNYYYALSDRRPASRKFARRRDGGKGGWILRAEEFISPKYRLSDAEHRARVSAWA